MSFGTLQLEFATLQSQTRLCGRSSHSHVCSKVSVTARTFSRQVHFYTSHRVRENQRTQAFCAYATFIHEAPGVSFSPWGLKLKSTLGLASFQSAAASDWNALQKHIKLDKLITIPAFKETISCILTEPCKCFLIF